MQNIIEYTGIKDTKMIKNLFFNATRICLDMTKEAKIKHHFTLLILLFLPFYLIANISIQDSLLTQLAKADAITQIKILEDLAMAPDVTAEQRVSYLKQAVDIAGNLNNELAKANALYELGYAYINKGDFELALVSAMESLTLFNENNKALEVAKVHTLLGTLYFYLENFNLASNHFERALEIRNELGDKQQIGNALTNMGNLLATTGNLDKAMEYYEEALKIKEDFNDMTGMSQIYNNIANIHFAKGEMDEVLPYRLKALRIDRETGDEWEIALKTYNLAEYFLTIKEPLKAYPYIMESKTISENLENRGLINDNIQFLSMYYELINDHKKALEYHKLYAKTIKETFSKDLSEQVGEMEVKYKTEKKEKENEIFKLQIEKNKLHKHRLYFALILSLVILIVLYYLYTYKNTIAKQLNIEIVERKKLENELELRVQKRTEELTLKTEQLEFENNKRIQAENKLSKNLKEKTLLLQEIMHRTKNNMAVITAILSVEIKRSDNKYINNSFKEIKNKIKTMSLVHEKLYQAEDLSNINMKEYIEDLLRFLMQSNNAEFRKIILKLDLQYVRILFDTALPLGLIINELISNIFKHAFPENRAGEISLKLYKESDGTVNIHLEDNGIGTSEDFDVRKNNSLGLTSVLAIMERQLKGEISLNSINGFKWHLKLKDNLKEQRI